MTNYEIIIDEATAFEVSEAILRDRTTGCLSCGAKWVLDPISKWAKRFGGLGRRTHHLDHRPDCSYWRFIESLRT